MRGAYVMNGERPSFDLDANPRGALFDIASATCSFGEDREWNESFHFLLAEEIPFAMRTGVLEQPFIEPLATAFFAIYPEGVTREPYRGFERDILETLGRAIMGPECWAHGQIQRGEILCRERSPWGTWGWNDPSGDLAASMFLCLKYLPLEEIGPWLTSALLIKDRYWRAQIIAFFVAAEDLLTGKVTQPSEMAKAQPPLAWEYSYVLTGIYYGAFAKPPLPFLPEARRKATLDAIAGYFDADIYFEWLCAIEEDAELEAELIGTTDAFQDLYLPAA